MNSIHPSAVLQGPIEMGHGNVIEAGASLIGPISLGNHNYIGPGASIGAISRERIESSHRLVEPLPADVSAVVIGDGSMIFDNAVIHKPLLAETRLGDGVEIGALSMVGHDCRIRDFAILSPRVGLGGYVTVGKWANLGLGSSVHNRLTIGAFSMSGMSSAIVGHVPPGALAYGNPARIQGANRVGMERAGFSADEIGDVLRRLRGEEISLKPQLSEVFADYDADRRNWPTSKTEIRWKRRRS
ncbi:hypothetical protein ACGFIP_22550 [Micromonospora zamorensis]|uniref:hypothetical protein n=1 Tax=Micromonospora zamorensis TaxID=709883 RepID=UPI0037186A5D